MAAFYSRNAASEESLEPCCDGAELIPEEIRRFLLTSVPPNPTWRRSSCSAAPGRDRCRCASWPGASTTEKAAFDLVEGGEVHIVTIDRPGMWHSTTAPATSWRRPSTSWRAAATDRHHPDHPLAHGADGAAVRRRLQAAKGLVTTAAVIYLLCTLTCLACAALLWRGWRQSRAHLLLYSSLCFGTGGEQRDPLVLYVFRLHRGEPAALPARRRLPGVGRCSSASSGRTTDERSPRRRHRHRFAVAGLFFFRFWRIYLEPVLPVLRPVLRDRGRATASCCTPSRDWTTIRRCTT